MAADYIEMSIWLDDDLKVAKIHWQWRGHAHKNGNGPDLATALERAKAAYIEEKAGR